MQNYFQQIKRVAAANVNVHICGEMGTGKQIAAIMIHKLSERQEFPIITVDCSSEWNGCIQVQFSEDEKNHENEMEEVVRRLLSKAGGGTLILYDICKLGVHYQEKLIKIIKQTQKASYQSFGKTPIARIITISHSSREALMHDVRIKNELYDLLHSVFIDLKPLRYSNGALPALANYYFNYYSESRVNHELPSPIMQQLLDYDWPGNLYELQNTIQRYLALNEISFLPVEAGFDEESVG